MTGLTLSVPVQAPAAEAFAAMVDWEAQSQWMLGTDVARSFGNADRVGGRLDAWTGIGRLGFLDTMVITKWNEAEMLVVVLHTGAVVKGEGEMQVVATSDTTCEFIWRERIVPPLGPLGRLGWPLLKPAFAAGVRKSLLDFAKLVETRRWRVRESHLLQ